eukprot:9985775-Karenia_brevis.AAC.1
MSLFYELRREGLLPDMITFSAAISACEKGGQWERVAPLLDEMRRKDLVPNVISFSAAISACEK